MDTPDTNKPSLMLVSADDIEGLREFVLALTGEELTPENEERIRRALADPGAAKGKS